MMVSEILKKGDEEVGAEDAYETDSGTDPTGAESTSEEGGDWQEDGCPGDGESSADGSGQTQDSSGPTAAAGAGAVGAGEAQLANEDVFSTKESILIFDWDDTVLPSTWVTKQGLRLDEDCILTDWQAEVLNNLAQHAEVTLKMAKEHGKVVLVTNAEAGWIELSCKKFMPTLEDSLEGLGILSARSAFEEPGLNSPFEWKYRAFQQEIVGFYGEKGNDPLQRKNVISFGDSAHEREAIIRVTSGMLNCRTKSLKFAERPEIDQLQKEHELITGCFRQIVQHDGNLDLCIRCS